MAPAEIRIRDYAENLFLFLQELNGRDFSIGFSEHERIRRLLARLAAEGRIPDDLGALKPYLAAAVCTTRAQQKEFYRRYERWAARFALDDGETGAKMSPETDPVEEFEKLGFRFGKWIPIFIFVAVLLVFGTVVLLTTDFGGIKKPVAGDTVAVPGSISSEPSQQTPAENRPQPITTTPPTVENTGPGEPAEPSEPTQKPLVPVAAFLCLVWSSPWRFETPGGILSSENIPRTR